MKVLVTGANGFIGRALCPRLTEGTHSVVRAVRQTSSPDEFVIGNLGPHTDWSQVLKGCDVVVHLAARVHVVGEFASDPLTDFRCANVVSTLNLAKQAAAAGVRRFVFVSSIKVNGESSEPSRPFTENDEPAPRDAYAISKFEAEVGLREIAEQVGLEVVIVRPPLVYGPGAKANFGTMLRWLSRGAPLPLGAITQNRRSLIALDNLIDLLVVCINHRAAANQIFLVSDGEDLSTADLLRRLGQAMGRPARLLPVSPTLLQLGATIVGRRGVSQRLCGSLQVDMSKARQLLGWSPPITVDEGLRRAVKGVRT